MKDILEKILDNGGEIKISVKDKDIEEWYQESAGIWKKRTGKYGVHLPYDNLSDGWLEADTLEEALEMFMPSCDNIGAVQQYIYLRDKIEDPDLLDTKDVEKLLYQEIERRKQYSRDAIIKRLNEMFENRYFMKWTSSETCCGYFDGIEWTIDVFNIRFGEIEKFQKECWDFKMKVHSEIGKTLTFIFHNPKSTKEFYSDVVPECYRKEDK